MLVTLKVGRDFKMAFTDRAQNEANVYFREQLFSVWNIYLIVGIMPENVINNTA